MAALHLGLESDDVEREKPARESEILAVESRVWQDSSADTFKRHICGSTRGASSIQQMRKNIFSRSDCGFAQKN